MEKNYWLALTLSLVILMGYPILLKKVVKTLPPAVQKAPAPVLEEAIPQLAAAVSPAVLEKGENAFFENDFYEIQFSTLGASVTRLFYKGLIDRPKFTQNLFYVSEPDQAGIFTLRLLNEQLDFSRVAFQMRKTEPGIFEFVYEKPGDFRLIKKFELQKDKPVIVLNVSLENLSPRPFRFSPELNYGLNHTLVPGEIPMNYGALAAQEKMHFSDLRKIAKKGFSVTGEYRWAGLTAKYFVMLVRPDSKALLYEAQSDATNLWAAMRFEPVAVEAGQKAEQQYFIYAGPKQYEMLKSFGFGFEEVLSRGVFGIFKIGLLWSLKHLDQMTHNFGWAIIFMTLFLKLAFTPLTHMSYQSMKKMQALQPKLQSLQQRHKSDPAKLNKETMELYRRNKVNPMGGCLPMLAQIPVFIAFYQVLNEMIELKGAPFIFWIHDLAAPDQLFTFPISLPFLGEHFNLLPIFMIASMVLQQRMTPQTASSPEQAQMMNFMPIIFGFLFYKMPSGLVLYWFVNNMLTVLHQGVIKKMGTVILHHEDRE